MSLECAIEGRLRFIAQRVGNLGHGQVALCQTGECSPHSPSGHVTHSRFAHKSVKCAANAERDIDASLASASSVHARPGSR
jgi:hypothetical protein